MLEKPRHVTIIMIFTNSAPLGRVGLGVAMSVVLSVCLSVCAIKSQGSKGGPRRAKQSPIVFEASHWSSDHMINSRPLFVQPHPTPRGLVDQLLPGSTRLLSEGLQAPLVNCPPWSLESKEVFWIGLMNQVLAGSTR